jgi:hypothetical protein
MGSFSISDLLYGIAGEAANNNRKELPQTGKKPRILSGKRKKQLDFHRRWEKCCRQNPKKDVK